jgi:hypothetical protein
MPAKYTLALQASRLPENPEAGMFREGKRGHDDLQDAPWLFLDNPWQTTPMIQPLGGKLLQGTESMDRLICRNY